MLKFVEHYDGGKLRNLADKIGASDDNIIKMILEGCFLWNIPAFGILIQVKTGSKELITDYTYVNATNEILHVTAHSKNDADTEWQEKLKFTSARCETLQEEYSKSERCV